MHVYETRFTGADPAIYLFALKGAQIRLGKAMQKLGWMSVMVDRHVLLN
jgi:hypothetical protein